MLLLSTQPGKQGLANLARKYLNDTERFETNFLKLNVFFVSLVVENVEEEPAYGSFSKFPTDIDGAVCRSFSINNLGNGGTYSFGDGRGIRFNAFQDLLIQSVVVYPSQASPGTPITVDIELRNSSNNTIAVRPIVLDNRLYLEDVVQ